MSTSAAEATGPVQTDQRSPAAVLLDRLARTVPADSRAVLEIGPPASSVAGRVKGGNPAIRCAVIGPSVFVSAPDAALATHLGAPGPRFDCLVVHQAVLSLPDPLGVIASARRYLEPGASILIVVPRPWLQTLNGGEAGSPLINRLQDLLAQRCGLVTDNAVTIAPQDVPDPAPGDFSHLIVRAVAAGTPLRRLLIQAMTLRPVGACNDTRIHLPHAQLAAVPGVRVMASVDHIPRLSAYPPGEQRIAVLQRRIFSAKSLPLFKRIIQEGYLVVAEFDDHPSHWPEIAEADHLTFRAVHAVQTSTDFLAGELRPFNPEIAVFPNQIAVLPPPRTPRPDGRVVLFFGAFNRDEDWRPLMEPLNRLLAANRGRVGVQVIHDRGFFDALDTPDKSFTPACGYRDYIRILSRSDIGLLPLNDTLFNRAKSDLKFIECAAHGVVTLASPVVYGEVVADGKTGLLFRTPEEFSAHLGRLIADQELRTGIAARAYDYVARNRLMAQHFRKRLDWYHALLNRKDELDARLFERVPALRP